MKKTSLCIYMFALALGATLQADECCEPCPLDCGPIDCGPAQCRTVLLPFSQAENSARRFSGVAHLQDLADEEDWNFHTDLAIEYQRNFNTQRLGRYFFPNGTNTLTVGPSSVGNAVDVRNIDLGLAANFTGTLTINPRIQNVVADAAMYLGLDRWFEGLWLDVELPIVWTQWNLDMCATSSELYQAFNTRLNGARFTNGTTNKIGVADIPIQLGFNFMNRDKGCLGAFIRAVFPTGRINNNLSVFTPTVGYDRYQIGGGLRGRIRMYEKDDVTAVNIQANFYATHIFKTNECRVFDMIGHECFSHYLRMLEADTQGNYTGNTINFVDKFKACVVSKIDWQLNFLTFFDLFHRGYTWQLGYELKSRAKEEFETCNVRLCNMNSCSDNRDCDCLGACSDIGNVLGGKQYGVAGDQVVAIGDPVLDQYLTTINTINPATTTALWNETNFATRLDYYGAALPSATAHKVWSYAGYTWTEPIYPKAIGIGAEIEFGNGQQVPNFWGVWVKGTVAYN